MSARLPIMLLLALLLGAVVTPTEARPRRAKKAHKRPKQHKPAAPTPDPAPSATAGSADAGAATPANPAAPTDVAESPGQGILPPLPLPLAPSAAPAGPASVPAVAPTASAPLVPAASPSPGKLGMRPATSAHGGFVADMDCSACHTEEGWKLASTAGASGFDHDRTGFPLRGAHVQAQCNRCHTGQARPATSCDGCHKDPHQGRHDGTCAECHTAVAWSDTNTLEQHRRTRMPLTGRHALIDCTACHKRQGERQFSGTPSDCYSCHRAQYVGAAVHPVHDGSTGLTPFPRDCGRCHQTTAWNPAFGDPDALPRTVMARTGQHDAVFVLSTGSHRAADCGSCHVDLRRAKLVRCDGCHLDAAVRAQHRTPVPRTASACLRCHPRGAAR